MQFKQKPLTKKLTKKKILFVYFKAVKSKSNYDIIISVVRGPPRTTMQKHFSKLKIGNSV